MSAAPAVIEAKVSAVLAGSRADLSELLVQLAPKAGATSAQTAFAELFWARWCKHCALHDGFLAQLAPLRAALAATEPALWVTSANHPLWSLLDIVRQAGAGYQPELGRAGDKVLADWRALLGPLQAGDWDAVLARARAYWQQEQQKLLRLEQRLIDAERGQLRSRRAQQRAARELNRAMAGQHFSADMANFLQVEWFRELQWCLLQYGEDGPQWQQRVGLTQRLIASLQDPGADPDARQYLYALIPEVESELRATLFERAHDTASVERQLASIEIVHMTLLKAQPLPSVAFTLIANDDPWMSSAMSISRDLLQRVIDLPLGSGYRVREGDADLRIRLALRSEDSGQLLFVNRLGLKALQKSFEEFAYWLATGIAQPLPDPADSPLVLRLLLQQLVMRSAQQAQALEELHERQQVEAQRRQAARDKAVAEAQVLAEARAQAAREAGEQAREQELQRRREQADGSYRGDDNQRLRQARQLAVGLAIGSWVELYDELGRTQRVRLAVKLSASGKLIFVDREGVRCAECERDEFAARLLDGSAHILDRGPQFEDTLARVVDSLRRDRANRE